MIIIWSYTSKSVPIFSSSAPALMVMATWPKEEMDIELEEAAGYEKCSGRGLGAGVSRVSRERRERGELAAEDSGVIRLSGAGGVCTRKRICHCKRVRSDLRKATWYTN